MGRQKCQMARMVVPKETELIHIPVLRLEVINFLAVQPGKKYLDTTVGGGGHAEAILKSGGELLGIDLDPQALEMARRHLSFACPDVDRWRLVHGNFADLKKIAQKYGFIPVSGVLFDLGVSSFQLADPKRGFSFRSNEALDMRMDPGSQKVTAQDLINGLNEGELYELFTRLGEEKYSRRLARAVCRARRIKPVETGGELSRIILAALPPKARYGRIHPATRVFQALRMAVNDELNNLKEALPLALEILDEGGRLVVLSFHSKEDKIVKEFFKKHQQQGQMRILTKKPIRPTLEEIEKNTRARSAKLRVGEKL